MGYRTGLTFLLKGEWADIIFKFSEYLYSLYVPAYDIFDTKQQYYQYLQLHHTDNSQYDALLHGR